MMNLQQLLAELNKQHPAAAAAAATAIAPKQQRVSRQIKSAYQDQPELAASIDADSTFSALQDEVEYERKAQAMRWWYAYVLSDSIDGQASKPFTVTIEQGTDFKCCALTASLFSYDSTATFPTSFPIPNSGGQINWAGRGVTVMITDTRAGRTLTSGQIPLELLATPGYGLSFIKPFPFKYWFLRNSKVQFDIRNLDNVTRSAANNCNHKFSIAMLGYKYLTPGS